MVTMLLALPVTHCKNMNIEFHILSQICRGHVINHHVTAQFLTNRAHVNNVSL